jgi:DNA-binding response OmpR family regulator
VALLDFVRRQDEAAGRRAGAAAVLAKPFLVHDLLWHLRTAIAAVSLSETRKPLHVPA